MSTKGNWEKRLCMGAFIVEKDKTDNKTIEFTGSVLVVNFHKFIYMGECMVWWFIFGICSIPWDSKKVC